MGAPLRIAAFASGGGSNFQAVAEALRREGSGAEVVLCLSNRAGAGALARAAELGIAGAVVAPEAYDDGARYCAELLDLLETHAANFIILAGYLKQIPSLVVQRYAGRMLNIHPSLLPAFGGRGMYGAHVHRAVLAYGARWSGATVHLVDETYDTGPIVLQEPTPVLPDDTPETLAARVLELEHRLYPEAVRLFAADRIRLEGRCVRILPPSATAISQPA